MASKGKIEALSGITLHHPKDQKEAMEAFAKMWTEFTKGEWPTKREDKEGRISKSLIADAMRRVDNTRNINVNSMVILGCRGTRYETFMFMQPLANLFDRAKVTLEHFFCQSDYSEGGLADEQFQVAISAWRNSHKFVKNVGGETVFKLKVSSTEAEAMIFAERQGFELKHAAIHPNDFHEYEKVIKH